MKPGLKDEWYTPPEIFEGLNTKFSLDPCHPDSKTYVPTEKYFTKSDNGLERNWIGKVWLNPPFGGRNGYFDWVRRFIEHGNGIGLMPSMTSSDGFHKFIPHMDHILFPKGKTRFYEEYGVRGGCPFQGIVLFSIGPENNRTLEKSNLGIFY